MRQGGSNNRRSRNNRHHNGGNGANGGGNPSNNGNQNSGNANAGRVRSAASLRHQTFDSNGPDVRVRGNAWQVYEKYQSLARDAFSSGDRVLAENYQQHAEHYYRVIEAINEATALEQRGRTPQPPYHGQPEVPQNYYAPDGSLLGAPTPAMSPAPASGEASVTATGPAAQHHMAHAPQPSLSPEQMAQMSAPATAGGAEVHRRGVPSALYTPEEIAAHHQADPLRMTS